MGFVRRLVGASALVLFAGSAMAAGQGWTLRFEEGPSVRYQSRRLSLDLGGRLQVDALSFFDVHGAAGDGTLEAALDDELFVRRGRLLADFELDERFVLRLQYDFASGEGRPADVYIGMNDLGPVGDLRIGHQKEPFSIAALTSSKYITLPERPAVVIAFAPARNLGLKVGNSLSADRITWAVGLFNDTDTEGRRLNNQAQLGGRLTGLPRLAPDGSKLVHLGLSYTGRSDTDFRFRARPETSRGPRTADTGPIVADRLRQLGAELAIVEGSFYLQAEAIGARTEGLAISGEERGDVDFGGYYVEASWFLTGEHKVYKPGSATFNRIVPRTQIGGQWPWGAWEIAARYSTLDLDAGDIEGGVLDTWSLAVNWYLHANSRITGGLTRGRTEAGDRVSSVLVRLQVEF